VTSFLCIYFQKAKLGKGHTEISQFSYLSLIFNLTLPRPEKSCKKSSQLGHFAKSFWRGMMNSVLSILLARGMRHANKQLIENVSQIAYANNLRNKRENELPIWPNIGPHSAAHTKPLLLRLQRD
jgi:hypothetical protein